MGFPIKFTPPAPRQRGIGYTRKAAKRAHKSRKGNQFTSRKGR